MTRQPQPANGKMQPLLTGTANGGAKSTTKTRRVGEVAGGTAAECAVICCCCPCTLMNLLVLAVVKVPARLCRKAKGGQRNMGGKKGQSLLGAGINGGGSRESLEKEVREIVANDVERSAAAVDLEQEMWDRVYRTGFWRSSSERGT